MIDQRRIPCDFYKISFAGPAPKTQICPRASCEPAISKCTWTELLLRKAPPRKMLYPLYSHRKEQSGANPACFASGQASKLAGNQSFRVGDTQQGSGAGMKKQEAGATARTA